MTPPGHTQNVLRYRLGHHHPPPRGSGEIPSVNEEFERQDANRRTGRFQLDPAVQSLSPVTVGGGHDRPNWRLLLPVLPVRHPWWTRGVVSATVDVALYVRGGAAQWNRPSAKTAGPRLNRNAQTVMRSRQTLRHTSNGTPGS